MFNESDLSSSDDLDDIDTIDPAEIYRLEDYIVEDNVFQACAHHIAVELKDKLEADKAGPSYSCSATKRQMERKRVETEQRLAIAISEATCHLAERTAALNRQLFSPLQKIITKAKAKHNAKAKLKASISVMGEESNISEGQATTKHEQAMMEQLQLQLSSKKLESAKPAHLTAKENRESKAREFESKMLDCYNKLLVADTTGMTEEIKDEHSKTLKCLRKRLFDNED